VHDETVRISSQSNPQSISTSSRYRGLNYSDPFGLCPPVSDCLLQAARLALELAVDFACGVSPCAPAPGVGLVASPEAHASQESAAKSGKSWATQKQAFWKAEAGSEGAAARWGEANVERMSGGLAPQLPDSWGTMRSVELHHSPTPFREGGTRVMPVTPEEHAAMDPFRRLGSKTERPVEPIEPMVPED
jgi:hypothetical protein